MDDDKYTPIDPLLQDDAKGNKINPTTDLVSGNLDER